MKKYRIFVDGSSGTTGLRIADRLAARPEFELLTIPEADRKDPNARAAVINRSDLTFLCLPDAAAREIIPLVKEEVRILDTSTAHRTASGWLYGMPELDNTRKALKTATRVAVPGCHKSMIAQYEADRTDEGLYAPRPYGLTLHHKHLPEMMAICGLHTAPVFCPVVADYYAGMETVVQLQRSQLNGDAKDLASVLADYYAGSPVITVHPFDPDNMPGFLPSNALAGKDSMEIFVTASPDGGQIQLISRFDNLGKGSSGAAVQCMNLMLGLEETEGLAL